VEEPPCPAAELAALPESGPAEVEAVEGGLRLGHRRFAATLDTDALRARVFRTEAAGAALEMTLRLALSARLPSLGALPLHAAALVLDGAGHVFFGPSGAGKSTLSSLAPGPVLSDEFVAVGGEPPELRSTGFWGELGEGAPAPTRAPLAALVELDRGAAFRLEPLEPTLALRRLLGVLLVPPLPARWAEAMSLAAQLSRMVPVYRMQWSPEEPPWTALKRAIAGS
jgi:hypothetical protein